MIGVKSVSYTHLVGDRGVLVRVRRDDPRVGRHPDQHGGGAAAAVFEGGGQGPAVGDIGHLDVYKRQVQT